MRALSIVLAILAAALWVSYPDYVIAYAYYSQSLPDVMFAVQVLLIVFAVLFAVRDEFESSSFEVQHLNALDAIADSSDPREAGGTGPWPGLPPPGR